MNFRLLSFLSDIETSVRADDPEPGEGGAWESVRMANYHLGLARVQLSVRLPDGTNQARGSVALQNYALADGTLCLRVELGWAGRENGKTLFVYSKPGVDWLREARKAAAEWMAGPPAQADTRVYDGVQLAPASALAV